MKHYVNFGLLIAFVILVTSAFLRFFQPFALATTRIHIVFGTTILLLVALHLASRLSYFGKILKTKGAAANRGSSPARLLLLPSLSCAYLLAACLLNWWPVPQLLSLSYEARNRAIIFRPESGAAFRRIDNRAQLKRQAENESSILIEIEWGESFQTAETQIAIWAESSTGSVIETFFVSEHSAFSEKLDWAGSEHRRVDILPIWRNQFTLASGVKPDGDIDSYSGATPEHDFSVESYLEEDPKGFYICIEVNAPDDSNKRYHSNQKENAEGYTKPGIGQPSVYYSAYVDPTANQQYYLMDYVGHGGSGSQQSGEVYYNSEYITTARHLVEKILIRLKRPY